MRLAIGIVAHKSRLRQAARLCRLLRPEACSVDNGTLGTDGNHLKILRWLAEYEDADWVMVLEDDAVLCHDFLFHVKQALDYAPGSIVGLYLGTGNPSGEVQRVIRQSYLAAQAWIVGDCLIGAVGYVIRASLLPDMLADIEKREGELSLRISRYAQDWDLRIAYTQPSLVDHADDPPVAGEVAGREERKAWCFGFTRDKWDTPAVPLGFCPDWSKG